MVVLLICLVLVVVAIVVVFRLLLAELARTAAYRQAQGRGLDAEPGAYAVNRGGAKGPISPATGRAMPRSELVAAGGVAGAPMSRAPYDPAYGDPAFVGDDARPRRREVAVATQVVWWRRLRSGTALALLVLLLGVAAAAVVGAIVLFTAFVVERAIS